MSIEMENPKTISEKVDAITNLIEQMYLAHQTHNEAMFKKAYEQAGELGFDVMLMLGDQPE